MAGRGQAWQGKGCNAAASIFSEGAGRCDAGRGWAWPGVARPGVAR